MFKNKFYISSVLLFLAIIIIGFTPSANEVIFNRINGFNDSVNEKLENFFNETNYYKGRKIAVLDADGTILGQVPHYLADECLYSIALENPGRKTKIIDTMKNQSNSSLDYIKNRLHYMSGDSLKYWREIGDKHFKKYYTGKVYKPMVDLVILLQKNNFEVWIVTASPEAIYQKLLSEVLNIPITRVMGIKTVIRDGIITDEIIEPVPQDHGKKEAIETFIQDRPLFAAGNSRGDKEMIEYASKLRMIVNPDDQITADQGESFAQYAKAKDWLIVKINDTTDVNSPIVSSKYFGIKQNKSNKVN